MTRYFPQSYGRITGWLLLVGCLSTASLTFADEPTDNNHTASMATDPATETAPSEAGPTNIDPVDSDLAEPTNSLSEDPVLAAAKPEMRAETDYYSVIVDDTYIEVHTGPGRGFPVFHVIERGDIIHLHKRRTDWIKISDKWGKISGWVKRSALSKTLGPDGVPLDFSGPDMDEYIARRWEMGVAVGDFNGADSLTFNLGYRFTSNVTAEFKVSQSTGQFSDNILMNLSVLHQPFPNWRVSPFFMLGAGVIETEPHATLVQTEDRSDTDMLVGGGVYIYLSRQFVLRLEYNNHLILTSRDENEEVNEWKLGFNVFF